MLILYIFIYITRFITADVQNYWWNPCRGARCVSLAVLSVAAPLRSSTLELHFSLSLIRMDLFALGAAIQRPTQRWGVCVRTFSVRPDAEECVAFASMWAGRGGFPPLELSWKEKLNMLQITTQSFVSLSRCKRDFRLLEIMNACDKELRYTFKKQSWLYAVIDQFLRWVSQLH